jgi:hypothetical protein
MISHKNGSTTDVIFAQKALEDSAPRRIMYFNSKNNISTGNMEITLLQLLQCKGWPILNSLENHWDI